MADRPMMCNAQELDKFGVDLVSESTVTLRCQTCGAVWSPNLQPGARLPKNYWKCPNGCYDKSQAEAKS